MTKQKHHKKLKVILPQGTKIYASVGFLVLAILAYSIFEANSFGNILDAKLIEAKENARPAEIQITTLAVIGCDDCYDINEVINTIKSTGVNVTKLETLDYQSDEANSLIAKHSITKLPSLIVSGELNRSSKLSTKLSSITRESNGYLIFTSPEPLFIDASSGTVRGEVILFNIKEESCNDCASIDSIVGQLSSSGVIFKEERDVVASSAEGKDLIKKYNITKLPSVVLDSEAAFYTDFVDAWLQVGSVESDGYFVLRNIPAPYYNTLDKRVRGLVDLIFLSDNTCSECYDPDSFHTPVLKSLGITFRNISKVNSTSVKGNELVEMYNITKLPTIIMQGDMSAYASLVQVWPQVGSEEEDGTYIFRSVEIGPGAYKDLETGQVMT